MENPGSIPYRHACVGFGIAHVIPGIMLIAVGASPVTEQPKTAIHAEVELAPSGADFALHF